MFMDNMKSNFSDIFYTIAPFLCFILGYAFCVLFFSNKTVSTPDLIGKTLHEAITLTSNMQINLQLIGEKECPGIKAGNIISQKPIAGRLIKTSQSILVMISKPSTDKTVPNITHLSLEQAELFCKEQQIKLKPYKIACNLPIGTCIGQSPTENEILAPQKIIAYYAINNNNFYIMPNFIGQSLQEVTHFLEQNNIEIHVFDNQSAFTKSDQKDKIIVGQNPYAGSIIQLNKKNLIQLNVE